ncbi:MAG: sugar phosphate isomerase/epimerase [Armatimonadetes bacterium]|nr:sugar phosphate isomerase/epimerase [Armatimonadota bacterium]
MQGIATVRFTWSSEAGRPEAEKSWEVFLAEAAAAGCDGVECHGPELAEMGPRYGLRCAGTYVGIRAHESWEALDAEQAVLPAAREAAALGGSYLAVNCDPKGGWAQREVKNEDELKRQGANLSRLAEAVAPLGLSLAMHNHANRLDLHLGDLRSVTEYATEQVGICLDTGWALTSADDPLERLRQLGSRVTAVHLRNQRGEVPTEWLGEGDLDLAALVAQLRAQGYHGWLTTELWHRPDVPRTRSLADNQQRSNALLREAWTGAKA